MEPSAEPAPASDLARDLVEVHTSVTPLTYGARSLAEGRLPPYLADREPLRTVTARQLPDGDDLGGPIHEEHNLAVNPTPPSDADGWIDVLVPATPDGEMGRLLDLKLRDGKVNFQPGPLDQAILGATTWFVRRAVRGDRDQALVVQLPRGQHDVAMLIGFAVQLLRLHALDRGRGTAEAFRGSVLMSAMDTGVQARLDTLGLPGTPLNGLAAALKVCRVRADGRLVTDEGSTVPFRPGRARMLYHNTRVGWPTLTREGDGFAVVDRTSIGNPDTYSHALRWASDHGVRRWIVVADLADEEAVRRLEDQGIQATVLPVVAETIDALQRNLGTSDTFTLLSTNAIAWQPRPDVRVEQCEATELDKLLRHSYGLLARARQIDAEFPPQLVSVARLLAGVSRCADRVLSYNQAAVEDHRARSLKSEANVLARRGDRFSGGAKFRVFGQTSWAQLRDSALQAYRLLQEQEPKYHQLIGLIDLLLREQDEPIRIRTASRAAARGLTATLRDEHPAWLHGERVTVLPWSQVMPWATGPITDVLVAPPPRYRAGLLFSGESTRRFVLAYPSEVALLRSAYEEAAARSSEDLEEFCRRLSLDVAPRVTALCSPDVPVEATVTGNSTRDVTIDFERALLGARLLADVAEDEEPVEPMARTGRLFEATVPLLPVQLASGGTWWLSPDAPVETLIGEKYHHRLASQLRAGDQVIVPRGDGREALFSRLVAAAHRGADVTLLDTLLGRFRRACVEAYNKAGQNWAELNRRLDAAGCNATTQARAWADGSTIAPADPEDVRIVAELAGDSGLASGWQEVATIAQELRRLHQKVGHLISRALVDLSRGDGDNLRKVEELLGDRAEVLDEFILDQVTSVGPAQQRPESDMGMIDG